MAPRLEAVVYVSSASHELSDEEPEALLADSRHRNERSGITGVLLYREGAFLQYFEGTPEAVADVYPRIAASRLHHDLVELMHASIARRAFPAWSMGCAHVPGTELLRLQNANWRRELAALPADERNTDGLALLAALASEFGVRPSH